MLELKQTTEKLPFLKLLFFHDYQHCSICKQKQLRIATVFSTKCYFKFTFKCLFFFCKQHFNMYYVFGINTKNKNKFRNLNKQNSHFLY